MKKEDVIEFLKDYYFICKKHNICLSHEDTHGSFIFNELNKNDIDWVLDGYYIGKNWFLDGSSME